jgi:hypothetical protein
MMNLQTKRQVSFQEVRVRTYDVTLGSNPSVTDGPPLALDWVYAQHAPKSVDDYERDRSTCRRGGSELRLSAEQRERKLIQNFGFTKCQLSSAMRKIIQPSKAIIRRAQSDKEEVFDKQKTHAMKKEGRGISDPYRCGSTPPAA